MFRLFLCSKSDSENGNSITGNGGERRNAFRLNHDEETFRVSLILTDEFSVPIPIPIVMPLTVMGVVPGMVLVPAFLASIREIATTLLGLAAALTVFADRIVKFGFSLFEVPLAFGSIIGVCRLNCYRSGKSGDEHCRPPSTTTWCLHLEKSPPWARMLMKNSGLEC